MDLEFLVEQEAFVDLILNVFSYSNCHLKLSFYRDNAVLFLN